MDNDKNSGRRTRMQKALANEMTRSELSEFLSDEKSKKEFFTLMKLKHKIGSIDGVSKKQNVSEFFPKKRNFEFKIGLLAAASLFLISSFAVYFRFFSEIKQEFEIVRSVVTGVCKVENEKQTLKINSGNDSFCDFKIEGELGLILRVFPNTEFEVSKGDETFSLQLNSGIVIFSTHKKNPSTKVRATVHKIQSELLGTTLTLISEKSSGRYRILVLEGGVRVKTGLSENLKSYDALAGYSVLEAENSQELTMDSELKIIRTEANDQTKYSELSENSKQLLNEKNSKHDPETIEYLKKEIQVNSTSSDPVYKITLKNRKSYMGTVEENENSYILTDKEGNRVEIEKKEIIELELVP
ncbi:LIMLP_03685 family anti-sigma factor [Leptospira stimsonii]|uniref:Iron dicitrate transport regulator FecR n=1 Tax=Leptospira stimsonii TaxID=2202203 RepID=A0ABY2N3N4_9LEPT|nr:iron dicitrate transport regulator FecR [Leptospira stimsonii]TGK26115.1 iron dicitrate transport regulator FecR [Leptospira stimsonii]TGM14943.1 iron dicitrate transport regulator FecR [Leptospira stimsonii]